MSIPVERIKDVIEELDAKRRVTRTKSEDMKKDSPGKYYGLGRIDGLEKSISLLESVVKEYGTDHSSPVSGDDAEETAQVPRQENGS